ncbi:hypothetical protein A4H97_17325 [Niastella yeongjuensis]|uniref:Outer membrane protein beta-barrel domain-containing protein n=1 Tax=Niastella yeongjuensis TaxID=354355 RepID=A0A1V9E1G7_9BACT|nr:hypothetical protein [Niastella yeongjuensis]OQP39978.1 hypothetical protein A4H97_17325 [Niastella yeongjuensis]SEO12346.1 hypothetical protein SAMN05660816_02210 [Niastella yeongjuensis]
MKIIAAIFIGCFLNVDANSQSFKFLGNYSLGLPQQQMAKNIQAIHSFNIGGLYSLPNHLKNLSVGLELGCGIYAYKKIDQTFYFDANPTVVPVNYSSSVFNANIQARYQFLDENNHLIVPYINAKAGSYNFYSDISIEDPSDPMGCHPLEKKKLINDNTFYWGAGVGFQINPSIHSKRQKKLPVLLDVSMNTIRGGNLDYINTKHLKDEQDFNPVDGKPMLVKFINVSTQDVHEHKVAQVYNSPLRILEIKAGVILKFEKL